MKLSCVANLLLPLPCSTWLHFGCLKIVRSGIVVWEEIGPSKYLRGDWAIHQFIHSADMSHHQYLPGTVLGVWWIQSIKIRFLVSMELSIFENFVTQSFQPVALTSLGNLLKCWISDQPQTYWIQIVIFTWSTQGQCTHLSSLSLNNWFSDCTLEGCRDL